MDIMKFTNYYSIWSPIIVDVTLHSYIAIHPQLYLLYYIINQQLYRRSLYPQKTNSIWGNSAHAMSTEEYVKDSLQKNKQLQPQKLGKPHKWRQPQKWRRPQKERRPQD